MTLAHIIKHTPPWITSAATIALIGYISLDSDPLSISHVHLFYGADKIIHFTMYFTLSTVLILDYAKTRLPHHTQLSTEVAFTTLAFALGLIFEVLQGTITENRSFDIYDIVANTTGAIAGFVFMKLWLMHKFRKLMVPHYGRHRHHHHSK